MRDAGKDLALALALFALGLGALLHIQYGPGEALQVSQDAQITYRSFPSAISVLLMLLSGLFALTSALAMRRARRDSAPPREAAGKEAAVSAKPPSRLVLRTMALLGLLVAFAALLGTMPLGVLASAFLLVAFFVFGRTDSRKMGAVAILGGTLFHGLFVIVLDLPLG